MIDFDALDRRAVIETSRGRRRIVIAIDPERRGLLVFNEEVDAHGMWARRGSFALVPERLKGSFAEAVLAAVEAP